MPAEVEAGYSLAEVHSIFVVDFCSLSIGKECCSCLHDLMQVGLLDSLIYYCTLLVMCVN